MYLHISFTVPVNRRHCIIHDAETQSLSRCYLFVTQQVGVLIIRTEHHVAQDRAPLHHRDRLVQQDVLGSRRNAIHSDLNKNREESGQFMLFLLRVRSNQLFNWYHITRLIKVRWRERHDGEPRKQTLEAPPWKTMTHIAKALRSLTDVVWQHPLVADWLK